MATILSEAGRYVTDQAAKHFRSQITVMLIVGFSLSAVGGVWIGISLTGKMPLWASAAGAFFTCLLVYSLWRWSDQKVNGFERQRLAMRSGASGESIVAMTLARFPDVFCIINDVPTAYGNLDHVVVGPTGVFVIDTKHWRGVVSADGRGELLHNGTPTDKPLIRQFVARVMETKEKIWPDPNLFFQPVFVFTAARVEARWKTTGKVHCIRDDQLSDYILSTKFRRGLNDNELEKIAQSFLNLTQAQMIRR